LEDLNFLFAHDSPFFWHAERTFASRTIEEAATDEKANQQGLLPERDLKV
jgi:hypothetical protein